MDHDCDLMGFHESQHLPKTPQRPWVDDPPLLADLRLSLSVAAQAGLRIASNAALAINPDRVSPCFLA